MELTRGVEGDQERWTSGELSPRSDEKRQRLIAALDPTARLGPHRFQHGQPRPSRRFHRYLGCSGVER